MVLLRLQWQHLIPKPCVSWTTPIRTNIKSPHMTEWWLGPIRPIRCSMKSYHSGRRIETRIQETLKSSRTTYSVFFLAALYGDILCTTNECTSNEWIKLYTIHLMQHCSSLEYQVGHKFASNPPLGASLDTWEAGWCVERRKNTSSWVEGLVKHIWNGFGSWFHLELIELGDSDCFLNNPALHVEDRQPKIATQRPNIDVSALLANADAWTILNRQHVEGFFEWKHSEKVLMVNESRWHFATFA